ncbi:hypothetical protein [Aquisphaera insulae]|uniref:hypothetical protein n=1 Tax=Aquisphaera insulae TaxID=2712864 RepID=UPI0013EB7E92|nr:hypothetical protein [Aquisphaera insulae]
MTETQALAIADDLIKGRTNGEVRRLTVEWRNGETMMQRVVQSDITREFLDDKQIREFASQARLVRAHWVIIYLIIYSQTETKGTWAHVKVDDETGETELFIRERPEHSGG